jgi:hypothetical protein
MIAIWDGKEGRGSRTAYAVELALQASVPVIDIVIYRESEMCSRAH